MMQAKSTGRIRQWLHTLDRDGRWCIVVSADPDAMASALALKRLLSHRVQEVAIAHVNAVTRPDNLAMIRYLRIPMHPWKSEFLNKFNKFAIVDSQPHHNAAFRGIPFSVVVDHHPVVPEWPISGDFVDIRPELGATSTLLTRYLQSLSLKPGRLLATALLYGIRTDTAAFERSGGETDLQAYRWLSRYADTGLLRRILRSEYLLEWLPLFSRAFRSLHTCRKGTLAHLGEVKSPDLLVAVADFFTRVHGLRWVAVSGVCDNVVVVIFRGDGGRDMGRFAAKSFGELGSAGGHRALARAEFPLGVVGEAKVGDFVRARLEGRRNIYAHPNAMGE